MSAVQGVAVVVVTYNSAREVAACLASLVAQTGVAPSITVVDNASSDDTLALVRRDFPQVRVDPTGENLGYGRANNRVLLSATEPYVAIINPDTIVPPSALAAAVDVLERDPHVGQVGLRHVGIAGEAQTSALPFPTVSALFGEMLGLDRLFGLRSALAPYVSTWVLRGFDPDRAAEVEWLKGSFLVVRAAAARAIGGFDGAYFMYGEDVDWARRLRAAGWSSRYLPAPAVVHIGGASAGASSPALYVEHLKGRLRYFDRHGGVLGGLGARLAVLGVVASRGAVSEVAAALGGFLAPERAGRADGRRALFREAGRWIAAGMPTAGPEPRPHQASGGRPA